MSKAERFNDLASLPIPPRRIRLEPSVIDADVIIQLFFDASALAGDLFIGEYKTPFYDSIEEWCYRVFPHETDEWKNLKFCRAYYAGENMIVNLQYTEKNRYADPLELQEKIQGVFN